MGKTVVVVDDEQDLCRLLDLAIRNRFPGVEVRTAFDGEAGLDLLRQARADLAILDIKMPRMNGYELLNRMRQEPALKSVPVLILTSLTEGSGKPDEAWAQSLEVEAFITKPYELESLLSRVESLLNLQS